MITRMKLGNFKCFSHLDLPLSRINVLSGLNGMGKSSVIQSLLLLKQSFGSGDLLEGRLLLGGPLADVGAGSDVLHEYADEDIVTFELQDAQFRDPWQIAFHYERNADLLRAYKIRAHRPPSFVPVGWRSQPPFGGNVIYIGAERWGPRKLYPLSQTKARDFEIGASGEYAVNLLNTHAGYMLEDDDPRCLGSGSRRLVDQVNLWLREVSPGAKVEMESVDAADAAVMGFSFERDGDVSSRRYRATNVGFGLSYVLSVVIALLSARSGSLVLIENPEAHLHPRGQTRIASLATTAARAGVQLVVETHSDHFLDGVRIAVKDGELSPEDVRFHYFKRGESGGVVETPEIDSSGRLTSWPEGFFDQHDRNLATLLAPRTSA